MSKAGKPGALASSAVDGTAATPQRVAAALGLGSAPTRTLSTVTPEASAASISRRVAVRSSPRAGPALSISKVPSPGGGAKQRGLVGHHREHQ
jgi:hypothetical protein